MAAPCYFPIRLLFKRRPIIRADPQSGAAEKIIVESIRNLSRFCAVRVTGWLKFRRL